MTDGQPRTGARGPGGQRKKRPSSTTAGRGAPSVRGGTNPGPQGAGAPNPRKPTQNRSRGRKGSPGTSTRKLAAELVGRIADDGAYANIAVPAALERSELPPRDRALVTELVYGTTRRRRSVDWLVDRYTSTEPDPVVRSFLRVGAYQLAFTSIPAYAAVSATVAAAPAKVRPFVNAVLRKLVKEDTPAWPDDGVRLSYPDWVIERLTDDLGESRAMAALEIMNEAPAVTSREDGYTQDLASQWVAATVGARSGEMVLDLCAAPGGKTTAMAASGARVVATDVRAHRVGLVVDNVRRLGLGDHVRSLVADGRHLPFPADLAFDRVLLDAPCSGLGALRRRPDARWRVEPDDVDALAALQKRLLTTALPTVKPGGILVYSVCTLDRAETTAIDDWLESEHPAWDAAGVEPVGVPGEQGGAGSPWEPAGRGFLLLPQTVGTDGMYLLALRAPA